MLIKPDDAASLGFRTARLWVWRLQLVKRGAHLLNRQADFFGDGARVNIDGTKLVGMGQQVGEDQEPVAVAS